MWSPRFRQRSIVLWAVWFVMIAAYNGPVVLLPALLVAAGFPDAARAALVVSVVMALPVVAATLLIDRVGRKPVIIVGLGAAALGAAGMGGATGEAGLVVAAILLAGVPVMMSDTPAQSALAPDLGDAAALVSLAAPTSMAQALDCLAGSPGTLD